MADTQTAPAENVLTQSQHISLLEAEVAKQTASLTQAKSDLEGRVASLESEKASLAAELSETKNRVDVLESEKVTAEQSAEAARVELDNFKSDIAHKARVEELKASRVERMKAANRQLADTYFTPERVTRWAEMSDEAFDSLVSDVAESATAAAVSDPVTASTQDVRQTAAFSGGPEDDDKTPGGSPLRSLLAAGRGRDVRKEG